MSRLKTIGWALVALLSLVMTVSGFFGLFEKHGDPEPAGRGRLHGAFVEDEPCARIPDRVCGHQPSARLDLPNGETEVLGQESLYDLVRRGGAVTVDIEWVKHLGSATRVRYEGRWYRAGYPKAGSTAGSLFALLFGAGLLLVSGLTLVGRLAPDEPARDPGPA